LQHESNVSYQWFFRAGTTDTYAAQSDTTAQISVDNKHPGQYKVLAQLPTCSTVREFVVAVESLQLKVDSIPDICDRTINTVSLHANYPGGTWSTPGAATAVVNQPAAALLVSKLAQGNYTVNYQYTSSEGCIYNASQSITIDRLLKPVIRSLPSLCGSTLLMADSVDQRTKINWFNNISMTNVLNASDSIAVKSTGDYVVVAYKSTCSTESNVFHATVVDHLAKPSIRSDGNFCNGSVRLFADSVATGSSVQWFTGSPSTQLGDTRDSITATSPGDYFLKVLNGTCVSQSGILHVEVARDSLFVPNVITPNGDLLNDEFQVRGTNLNNFYLEVINRYGARVFQTNDAEFKWKPGDISSGTYFWYVSYFDCSAEIKKFKGWLAILR
jgi:gliding motility-associated-like protein